MKRDERDELILTVGVCLFVTSIFLLLCLGLFSGLNSKGYVCDTETWYKCCNNVPCSDTYYDSKNDRCVFTLCENNYIFTNKNDCYYKPTN